MCLWKLFYNEQHHVSKQITLWNCVSMLFIEKLNMYASLDDKLNYFNCLAYKTNNEKKYA